MALEMAREKAMTVDDRINRAQSSLIATKPGAVPPHNDLGGHLPFGGTMKGGTAGNSAFGKRKIVTSDADPNPQACMLNYPPQPTEMNLKIWKDNCAPPPPARRRAAHQNSPLTTHPRPPADSSNMFFDPAAEDRRFTSTNHVTWGHIRDDQPSCLAEAKRSLGDLRQTMGSRSTPKPAYYPPDERVNKPVEASAVYKWEWPAHKTRPGWGRSIAQEPRKEMEFIEEYDLRPPWLKY